LKVQWLIWSGYGIKPQLSSPTRAGPWTEWGVWSLRAMRAERMEKKTEVAKRSFWFLIGPTNCRGL